MVGSNRWVPPKSALDFYDGGLLAKLSLPPKLGSIPIDLLSEADHDRLQDDAFGLIVITK